MAAASLSLMLAACGSAEPYSSEPQVDVPEPLRAAYVDVERARFALAACRAPEQRLAIGGLDSERQRAGAALAGRYADVTLAELRRAAEREMLTAHVEACPNAPGIERYRGAISALRQQVERG